MQPEGGITPPERDGEPLEEVVGSFHGGIPRRFPKLWPMLEMVLIASLLQPPNVSTTKGINEALTNRQAAK